MNKTRRAFDEKFKAMAVELAYSKGSIREAADELGIGMSALGKWKKTLKRGEPIVKADSAMTEQEKEIKRLKWELKETSLERDILKKAINIFSRSDGKNLGS